MPLFAGFATKFILFQAVAEEGLLWLAAHGGGQQLRYPSTTTCWSSGRCTSAEAEEKTRLRVPFAVNAVIFVLVVGVFVVGLFPHPLFDAVGQRDGVDLPDGSDNRHHRRPVASDAAEIGPAPYSPFPPAVHHRRPFRRVLLAPPPLLAAWPLPLWTALDSRQPAALADPPPGERRSTCSRCLLGVECWSWARLRLLQRRGGPPFGPRGRAALSRPAAGDDACPTATPRGRTASGTPRSSLPAPLTCPWRATPWTGRFS